MELVLLHPWALRDPGYSPEVATSLLEAQEWDKLECWMGVVWIGWLPWTNTTVEDVDCAMVSLFHQQPDAVQKLTRRVERWSTSYCHEVPEAFERICKRPHEMAQFDAL